MRAGFTPSNGLLFAAGLLGALAARAGYFYAAPEACRRRLIRQDRRMRDTMPQSQLDHMIEDSFPASDPPSVY